MKRRILESDGNGGFWISKTMLWTLIVMLVSTIITNYVQFTVAQNEIEHHSKKLDNIVPALAKTQEEVAVLKVQMDSMHQTMEKMDKKLDYLVDQERE